MNTYLARLVVLCLAAAAFWVGRELMRGGMAQPPVATETPYGDGDDPIGLTETTHSELVVVIVASGTCGACADPALPRILGEARDVVYTRATELGLTARTIGVGIDEDPLQGERQLRRFGPFDEINVGGGWQNLGTFRFVWDEHPGRAAVPQVVVLHRTTRAVPTRILGNEEVVLARYVGLDQLTAWSQQDYPLPTLPSSTPPDA